MHVSCSCPQVGLAEPMHHCLRVLPGVDQPPSMRMPHLVGRRLERNPAFLYRTPPDPVPDRLLQVEFVGIPRLPPPPPNLPRGGGRPPLTHPLAPIVPGPLPTSRTPTLSLRI